MAVQVVEVGDRFWRSAYETHGPTVLAYLLRRIRRRDEAEDLLQETFMRAMRAGTYQDGNLRAYLIRIAHNLHVNRLRRPRLVETDGEVVERVAAEEVGESAGPERSAAWHAFERRLAQVLAQLPPAQRTAFELGVIQQRGYDEVARMTGSNVSTVKVWVHRARKKILAELGDDLSDLRGVWS